MRLRSLALSIAAVTVIGGVSPVVAQSDRAGKFLCEELEGGWLRAICLEALDDSASTRLDTAERFVDDLAGRWEDKIQALPSDSADPKTRRDALAAMAGMVKADADWLAGGHAAIMGWLEGRRHTEASLEIMRELPGLPPEFALAINTVAMADFRADRARGERIRTDMVTLLAELDELASSIEALLEGVDLEIQNAPVVTAFDGVWSSTYGGEMVLTQDGFKVTGTYDYDGGRVEFSVIDELTLDGFWVEEGSRVSCETTKLGSEHWGRLRLEFSEDFTSYSGLWDYCDNEPLRGTAGGWWGDFLRARGTQPDGE